MNVPELTIAPDGVWLQRENEEPERIEPDRIMIILPDGRKMSIGRVVEILLTTQRFTRDMVNRLL